MTPYAGMCTGNPVDGRRMPAFVPEILHLRERDAGLLVEKGALRIKLAQVPFERLPRQSLRRGRQKSISSSTQWFSKVLKAVVFKRADIRAFEWIYPLQHSGVVKGEWIAKAEFGSVNLPPPTREHLARASG